MTCTPAKGKGAAAKVKVTCSIKLAAAAHARVRASFMRGARVVAAASGVRHSNGGISLRVRRAQIARGRYNLVLSFTVDGRRTTVTQRIRVEPAAPAGERQLRWVGRLGSHRRRGEMAERRVSRRQAGKVDTRGAFSALCAANAPRTHAAVESRSSTQRS